jgi:hypothetical protein
MLLAQPAHGSGITRTGVSCAHKRQHTAWRAREGQRLAWVRPARLADYPMPPAEVPLVASLRDLL